MPKKHSSKRPSQKTPKLYRYTFGINSPETGAPTRSAELARALALIDKATAIVTDRIKHNLAAGHPGSAHLLTSALSDVTSGRFRLAEVNGA